MKNMIKKKCHNCGSVYYVRPDRKDSSRFCSCKCWTTSKESRLIVKIATTIRSRLGIFRSPIKHGYSKHPLHGLWRNIKDRCYNKNNSHYNIYGGRGIVVCDEWIKNAKTFIEWALDNGYKKGLTIDRINNSGIYEPTNCRFTDMKTQARNTRNNIVFDGKTVAEWAEILNKNPHTIYSRIDKGMSLINAIFDETKKNGSWQRNRIILKDKFGKFARKSKLTGDQI